MVDLARRQLDGDLAGKRITDWGPAFKPETDDIRDSPALTVAQKLHELGGYRNRGSATTLDVPTPGIWLRTLHCGKAPTPASPAGAPSSSRAGQ